MRVDSGQITQICVEREKRLLYHYKVLMKTRGIFSQSII